MSEDFRQNGLIGVTGQQGVGKSFLNNLYAQQYILDNPKTRKVGKKVLIFDAVYDRQYANYPILKWTDISKQPQRTIARVIPQHPNGRKFSADDFKKGFYKLLAEYSNGMLILEDYNKYGLGTRNNDVIGPLTTARHNGVDILFSMQNMSKITTEMWENITWYRFHKQTTSVDAQRNDIENFELLKIAEIIVNEEYRKAALLFRAKKLTELEFKKRCSYHVWVDFKRLTIQGCSYEKFKWAALQMIIEQPRKISQYCKQKGYVYQKQSDYQAAVKELLISYLPLYKE